MPLPSGTRIGLFEIVEQIGAGGMGEVYRARDTRLAREVALKVLPPTFTRDPDRLARFEREARMLASLNHPNIASIYGIEETADLRAIILELVEGENLGERLANRRSSGRGGLPVAEALVIARQIADALDAAHERGIIHRDRLLRASVAPWFVLSDLRPALVWRRSYPASLAAPRRPRGCCVPSASDCHSR